KTVEGGMPCTAEVAIAETMEDGTLWTGLNFSPTFRAPFTDTFLVSPRFTAHGLTSFLHMAHALPGESRNIQTAVAVHVSCPAFEFTDRGKTSLKVPAWMGSLLEQALWKPTKALYEEEEKRRKNAAKARREEAERERARPSDADRDDESGRL